MPAPNVPSVHEPDESVHVTSDDPVFVALTLPVAPASSAVTSTVNVGVGSLVMSSMLETPESLAASRFGTPIADAAESIVMIDASLFAVGPALLEESDTELAASRTVTAPSDVHTTDTVTEVPEAADGVKLQPVAAPEVATLLKSPEVTPDTLSLNARVYERVREFDDPGTVHEAVGGVTSTTVMVVLAVAAVAGPRLPDVSEAPLTAKTGMTVPGPHPDTVTVLVEPESEPGLKVHPVAEPAFEKSPDATPVTDSEKVSV